MHNYSHLFYDNGGARAPPSVHSDRRRADTQHLTVTFVRRRALPAAGRGALWPETRPSVYRRADAPLSADVGKTDIPPSPTNARRDNAYPSEGGGGVDRRPSEVPRGKQTDRGPALRSGGWFWQGEGVRSGRMSGHVRTSPRLCSGGA
ncbi:hypothetical protein AAFF_G00352570 [Aldrovandia affinis]|uniref:Uncharacterized protein n=1 Tax=Aldrovandia affinis TaxID=143900 RepID=A0AAD7WNS6_9TELE|nr:hypothetical protein AAFF_G00352570 [Aldrovandia affinis]